MTDNAATPIPGAAPKKVIPFQLKAVDTPPTFSPETQACLDLILAVRTRIMAGEYAPTGIVIGIIEARGELEESYALSAGLTRMELIGNLHALATEITLEGS